MTKTPNHNYNTPTKGTTDWDDLLNENFEQLETDVEIRDTEANKGDYEPKEGAKYEATDSGAVYYGNGTSWILANRQVELIQARELNSNAHFVFPNQDFAGIQSAVDNASPGDYIYVLSGTYERGHEDLYFTISKELHLRGWGRPKLTLSDGLDTDIKSVVRFRNGSDGSSIKGFEVDGNLDGQTVPTFTQGGTPTSHGIVAEPDDFGDVIRDITIENCYIHNTVRSNIVVSSHNSVVRDVHLKNSGHDHWLYLAGAVDSLIENVTCEGFSRISGIIFSTTNRKCHGTTLRNLTAKNLTDNPYDETMYNIVNFRDEGTAYGNKMCDISINNSGGVVPTNVKVGQEETTLRDWRMITTNSHSPIVNVAADDVTMDNMAVELDTAAVDDKMSLLKGNEVTNLSVNNCQLSHTNSDFRCYAVIDINNCSEVNITNSTLSTPDIAVRVQNFSSKIWTENLNIISGDVISESDSYWAENKYAEETANADVPQGAYAEGTIVDFTDADDGSGTGRYLITRVNGPVLL